MGCNCSKSSQPYQPRPKDIPIELDVREECTVKDERGTTDNAEHTGRDVEYIITRALEEHLNGYKVYESSVQRCTLQYPIHVLFVKRDDRISITPNEEGKGLIHERSNTRYQLYAAVNDTAKSVVFLYQWCNGGKTNVSSPYHLTSTSDSIIPCRVEDITYELKEENNENAVRKVKTILERIIDENNKCEKQGTVYDFSIRVPGGKMYWRDIGRSRDIRLTDNGSRKLILLLDEILSV